MDCCGVLCHATCSKKSDRMIMAESRRKQLFPEVTDEQWNDWKWQVKNRIETLEELKKYVSLTAEEEEGVKQTLKTLRMAITPYYLSLINPDDPHDPVRRQCIPTGLETHQAAADLLDPLHEDEDSPTPGLTHRYPDRVLFLITDMCSMYCRHCTRRRFAGQTDNECGIDRIEKALEYIRNTPTVRDVLLSGGDALTSRNCVRFLMWKSYAWVPVLPWFARSASRPNCAIC